MPRTPHVEPWLSDLELLEWVRTAESRGAYQRRLAVWFTYLRHYPAHEVAALLGVEHVWEYLRENHFGNDTFPTLEAVGERLGEGLRTLATQPELVRSLTCFDWLNTIRLSSN